MYGKEKLVTVTTKSTKCGVSVDKNKVFKIDVKKGWSAGTKVVVVLMAVGGCDWGCGGYGCSEDGFWGGGCVSYVLWFCGGCGCSGGSMVVLMVFILLPDTFTLHFHHCR